VINRLPWTGHQAPIWFFVISINESSCSTPYRIYPYLYSWVRDVRMGKSGEKSVSLHS